jgi:hypothetical protein
LVLTLIDLVDEADEDVAAVGIAVDADADADAVDGEPLVDAAKDSVARASNNSRSSSSSSSEEESENSE